MIIKQSLYKTKNYLIRGEAALDNYKSMFNRNNEL